MADLYNYVIVPTPELDQVREQLLAELTQGRKWQVVPASASGARHVSIWCSAEGFTVVELDSSWDEPDPDLAKSLSKRCAMSAAAYYFTGAGDWESLDLFDRGKPMGSFSLNDAAGEWEVTKAKQRVFHHEWIDAEDDETTEQRVRSAFEKARNEAFAPGPLLGLVRNDGWQELAPVVGVSPLVLSFLAPEPEPVLATVEAALQRWVEPLLSVLAMTRGKAEPRQLEGAIAYERPVGERRLRVQYSFDGGPHRIGQRFECLEWDAKCKCWLAPHVEIGNVEQFQPYQSPAHLDRACRFLAASLAREWDKVSELAPPLKEELERASQTEEWRRAASEYDDLWRTRLVANEREPGWTPAKLVFRSANLMLVETDEKERFTFKFDTSAVPDSKDIAVGAIWETSSGGARARRLKVGEQLFCFDEEGAFQENGRP